MMIEEFEKLTGIYPSAEAYTVIESYYLDYPGTKQDFCKAFRGNTDGLAQQIQRELNSIHWKKERDSKATHAKMASEIETLKKQLEREQEWRPYEDTDNVQQADYEKLLTAGDTKVMTDDEAKDLLYNWFGFAKEKVQILRSIPTYEVNRHRQLRKVGEQQRAPLYNATDWNYIRFNCGRISYELYNDDLRPYLH